MLFLFAISVALLTFTIISVVKIIKYSINKKKKEMKLPLAEIIFLGLEIMTFTILSVISIIAG
jgi:hypothetical protein